MKIEKNKVVFASVLAVVLIFITAYTYMVYSEDENETENLDQTTVPKLEGEEKEYESKLDAINALKEIRETNAPSIYDESLIDTAGYYDPELSERVKQRMIDSIYELGSLRSEKLNQQWQQEEIIKPEITLNDPEEQINAEIKQPLSARELGLEHLLFFSSNPAPIVGMDNPNTNNWIYAEVDGTQVVKKNSRLRMRLSEDAKIAGRIYTKNSLVYGFISFQPNRALIEIEHIDHQPVKLRAFDLQDGSEGIYIENSMRAEATREVVDDLIQDINIAGVPQVSGIKNVFQRNNRNIRVTVTNNYKLILKPN
ncbi:conjugative transposon protein TraM [Gramella sp. MT6]|uniref:conjugative transposon protein TraM n=1 Tax=Gramella sp. MT6 TaxID=2705471 RepID=UPI001C5DAF6B|nr:conjugative transposon protein TraM [Gramella sp. MT6]QYA26723.1 conjugative transposon protein TraM [Gramella sp. MT6]